MLSKYVIKRKVLRHKLNGNVRKNYLFQQRKSPCVFVVVEPDFPKTPSSELDRKSMILHQSQRIFRYGTVASLSVLRLLYVSDVIFCTMQNFNEAEIYILRRRFLVNSSHCT